MSTFETMKLLEASDEAYRAAGETFDAHWNGIFAAQVAEGYTGEVRQSLYQAAFAGGIILDKVIDPSQVRFREGYNDSEDPVWGTIDQQHAESLANTFIARLEVRIRSQSRRLNDMESSPKLAPQGKLEIDFSLRGRNLNSENPRGLWFPEWTTTDGLYTPYSTNLDAIEWHLPENDEVQTGGNTMRHAMALDTATPSGLIRVGVTK